MMYYDCVSDGCRVFLTANAVENQNDKVLIPIWILVESLRNQNAEVVIPILILELVHLESYLNNV